MTGPAIIALAALMLSFTASLLLQQRLRRRRPSDLPFRWGYFSGCLSIAVGVSMSAVALAPSKTEANPLGVLILLLMSAAYLVVGAGVVSRKRWAWVTMTVLQWNPVSWAVNFVYGRNRWNELSRRAVSANSGHIQPARARQVRERVTSLHRGQLVILWVVTALIAGASIGTALHLRRTAEQHYLSVTTSMNELLARPVEDPIWSDTKLLGSMMAGQSAAVQRVRMHRSITVPLAASLSAAFLALQLLLTWWWFDARR